MSRLKLSNTVLTLLSVEKTFISVGEKWFRTYVTDTLGPENDGYVDMVLGDCHVSPLHMLIET